MRGKTFAHGLGAFAGSIVVTPLSGRCSRFTATVGIDDAADGKGSAAFQVWMDGKKRYDSGVMTGIDAANSVDLDVTGAMLLKLVTTSGGDTEDGDFADWAGAVLSCE